MHISEFDFHLPESHIALRPAEPRDSARLLVVKPEQEFQDAIVTDILQEVRPGDILVVNNTRVIPTQLFGTRGAARTSVTLIKRVDDGLWWGFARNSKRLRLDDVIDFGNGLTAQVREKNLDGRLLLAFAGFASPFELALEQYGAMPLPPYIVSKRPADDQDRADYQTTFAKADGSVAAPTAGLHFTPELIDQFITRGIQIAEVTLHVGAGTFLPMKTEDTNDHIMHAEWGVVTAEACALVNTARASGGRIICVGTTSLRLIESAADDSGAVHPFTGETAIFITPGYRFKTADMMITNFHLPKSTLFMLVSAFAGLARMKSAYAHAIANNYRFYSYGDASLLYRHPAD
jgi:S-adenosylmethionine:tRNA ribosyltransferase-isomerase